jgi:hypothetical protein
MNRSTSCRQHTPTSSGQLQADTAIQGNATRSARAASTSSNSDAASVASTYGSTESTSSRKRKLDEAVEMLDGVNITPRTAAPNLQSLRCDTPFITARQQRVVRGRRNRISTTVQSIKGNGIKPFASAAQGHFAMPTLPCHHKKLRTQDLGIQTCDASPAPSPTYAAIPVDTPMQLASSTIDANLRKKRSASLPLQYEELLSRDAPYHSSAQSLAAVPPAQKAQAEPKSLEQLALGKMPVQVQSYEGSYEVLSMPPLVPLDPMGSEPLPLLTYSQLVTIHQIHLPRPPTIRPSALHTHLRRPSALPGIRSGRPTLQHTRSTSQGNALPSIPSLRPPVTKDTLKELDLNQILLEKQLRHDVVFDADLVFRPSFDGDR